MYSNQVVAKATLEIYPIYSGWSIVAVMVWEMYKKQGLLVIATFDNFFLLYSFTVLFCFFK